jgi:hypothetical protein
MMGDQVQLSSLRVSAEMDASGYKTGADAIEAANKRIADSGQSAGAALAVTPTASNAPASSANIFSSIPFAMSERFAQPS